MGRSRLLVFLLFVMFLAGGLSFGQASDASLQGTVLDPSGALIPSAAIEIKNVDTGFSHKLTSDDEGRWRESALPPGTYELRISAPGFQTVVQKDLVLTVGQNAVADVNLPVGMTGSEVVVAANSEQLNLVSGAASGLVDEKQMRELPLNGRSFQQLALLQTGVNAVLTGGSDPVGGRTPKISINGTRPEQSSFLLDGTDINNVYNKTPGSVGGVLLGVEAVLEFQVLTNSYSSEFGRAAGGVINAVTRSGTNQTHGSVFEFLRNSALDSKNYFDPAANPIPALKRHQFGGVLGGPIRRDRTFFFGAFESLIERLGVTGVSAVPDDNARRGFLPTSATDPTLRPVPLNPAIPAYLNLFPQANGRSLGGGAAQYLFTLSQPTNEYFAQGRIDHRFSEHNSLFGRYTFDNGNVDRPPVNKPPLATTKERSRNQYVTLEYQHVFSPALLNSLRLGFNRSTQESDNQRTLAIPPQLSWLPGQPFGYLTITGLMTEAFGDYRLPRNDHLNNWQVNETVFWNRGSHGIRLGFEEQRMQFNQNTSSQVGGIVTFNGLENFLRGIPATMDFAVPGKVDPIRGYRQSLFGMFFQDDYRVRRNLTVNLGLRYEFATTPTEVNGKTANLRYISDTKITIGDPWHNNPSLKNFAPRVGFAWDPFSTGRTSIRGGFGIFYDEILPKYYFFSGSLNPPFTTRTTIRNPQFPNLLAGFDPNAYIVATLQTVNYDLQSAYVMQSNLSIQRQLPWDWTLTTGFAMSRGLHLFRIGDANLAPSADVNGIKVYQPQLGRRNPLFGTVTQRITDAQSAYNALQTSALKRFSHGFRVQLSYTWSKAIDDASGINSQDYSNGSPYVSDWYDRKFDRGLSNFWAQHVFTGNWSYELPLGKSWRGAAGFLAKGWQLNNITTLQTGHPFEVRLGFNRSGNLNTTSYSIHERPDLKPGYSNNPILGGPDRYWDINAFTLQTINTRGNLGRNTLIGPGLVNLDFSLAKEFVLNEHKRFEFRAEMFNAPNHPNFSPPNGRTAFTSVDTAGRGVIAPDWGTITSTVTAARQIQFGLKYMF